MKKCYILILLLLVVSCVWAQAPTTSDTVFYIGISDTLVIQESYFPFSDGADVDVLDSVHFVSIPAGGTLWVDYNDDNIADAHEIRSANDSVSASDLSLGRLKYASASSNSTQTFDFQVDDGDEGLSSTATFTIDVGGVVINEVVTSPLRDWGGRGFDTDSSSQVGSSSEVDEYVELFIKNSGIDLTDWVIQIDRDQNGIIDEAGTNDFEGNIFNGSTAFTTIQYIGTGSYTDTDSGDFVLLGNPEASEDMLTDVGLVLRDHTGNLVDSLAMNRDGAPSGSSASGLAYEAVFRSTNGSDSNIDSDDFFNGFATPGRSNDAPIIVNSAVYDNNRNGKLDSMVLWFNVGLDETSIATSDFDLSGDYTLSFVNTAIDANDSIIALRLVEDSDFDTDSLPDVSIVSGADGLRSRAPFNDTTFSYSYIHTVDSAAPVVIHTSAHDQDQDGQTDSLVFIFSEDLNTASITEADFTFPNGDFGYNSNFTSSSNDTITFLLNELGIVDSDTVPTVSLTSDDFVDAAGNILVDTSYQVSDSADMIIQQASVFDNDSDGSIDSIWIEFSEPLDLDGSPLVDANDFSLSGGYVISSVNTGLADSTLALILTESGSYDTDSTPSISYGGSADLVSLNQNSFISSNTPFTPADSAAPVIVYAQTRDGDGDGRIDSMVVAFSEPINDATLSNGEIDVLNYSSESNDLDFTASDTAFVMAIDEILSGFDTDSVPNIQIASSAFSDLAGVVNPSQTFSSTTDGAGPIVIAETVETNNSYIEVVFSEGVVKSAGGTLQTSDFDYQQTGGAGTYSLDAITDFSDNALLANTGEDTIRFYLSQTGGTSDGNEVIRIKALTTTTITDTTLNNFLIDSAQVTLNSGVGVFEFDSFFVASDNSYLLLSFTESVDGTSGVPAPANRTTSLDIDNFAGGGTDNLTFTFSDPDGSLNTGANPVTDAASFFTHIMGSDVNTYQPDNALAENTGNDTIRIRMSGASGYLFNGDETLTFSPGGDNIYGESTNKTMLSSESIVVSLNDVFAPTFDTAIFYDTNRDGTIDEVVIEMSENIEDDSISVADFVIAGANPTSVLSSGGNSYDSFTADDSLFTLQVSIAGTSTDTLSVIYVPGSLADLSANLAGDSVMSGSMILDSAAAVIASATTLDTDKNGKIDNMSVVFSEDITDPGFANYATIFTLTNPSWSIDNTSNGLQANDSILVLSITETSAFNTDLVPDISLAAATIDDIASGSVRIQSAQNFTSAQDGAAPAIVSAFSIDENNDGYSDAIEIEFSEAVDDFDFLDNRADWSVSSDNFASSDNISQHSTGVDSLTGGTATVVFNDQYVKLRWSPDSTIGTGQYWLSYENTLGDITDVASNQNPIQDTSSVLVTDKSAPRIIQTVSLDSVVDGHVERVEFRFSEPVNDSDFVLPSIKNFTFSDDDFVSADTAISFSTSVFSLTADTVNNTADDEFATLIFTPSNVQGTDAIKYKYADPSFGTINDTTGIAISAVSTGVSITDGATPYFIELNARAESTPTLVDSFYVSGDSIRLFADLGETGLDVTANLSNLNASFSSSVSFSDEGDNTYTYTTVAVDLMDETNGTPHTIPVTVTDDVGNTTTINDSLRVYIDTSVPSVTITSTASDSTNLASIPFTVTFTEVMSGFGSSDVTVGNGSVTSLVINTDSSTFDGLITPSADGEVTIDIAQNVATDTIGNGNAAATQFSIISDRTGPVATITRNAISSGLDFRTSDDSVSFDIAFSEKIDASSFVLADIQVLGKNGSVDYSTDVDSALVADGDDQNYTFAIWNLPASDTLRIAIGSGTSTDILGNSNATVVTSDSIIIDFDSLAVSFELNAVVTGADSLTNQDSVSFTIVFDADVDPASVNKSDFDPYVSDSSTVAFTSTSLTGSGDTLVYSILGLIGDGDVSLALSSGEVLDSAGNPQVTSVRSEYFWIDNTAPVIDSITTNETDPTGATTMSLTIYFSESVRGFALSDITTSGTDAENSLSSSSDSSVFTLSIDPTANSTVTVDIAGGVATDSAGNGNTAASQFSIESDRTTPTVAITRNTIEDGLDFRTNGDSVAFDIAFSEALDPASFELSDIYIISNNGVDYSAGIDSVLVNDGDNQNYTFSMWNLPMTSDTVRIAIGVGTYDDFAGNTNVDTVASDSVILDYDAPSASITANAFVNGDDVNHVTNDDSVRFSIVFDADIDPSTFSSADINTRTTGTVSFSSINLTGSGTDWNFDISGISGDGFLAIELGTSVRDSASNAIGSTVLATDTITIDNTAPVVTVNDLFTTDTTPGITGTVNDSDVFLSLTVNSVIYDDQADFTIGGGNWTFADNTVAALGAGVYDVSVSARDSASNVGNDATTNELEIDATAPIVSSVERWSPDDSLSIKSNSAVFRVTFNEGVQDAGQTDDYQAFSLSVTSSGLSVAVVNDSISDITVSGIDGSSGIDTLFIAVTVDASGTQIADLAGNLMTDTTVSGTYEYYIIDQIAPRVHSISRKNDSLGVVGNYDFRIIFDEPVKNVNTSDFVLGDGFGGTGSVTSVTKVSNTIYDVLVNVSSGTDTLGIDFSGSQDITDEVGNAFAGNISSEELYYVDNTAPFFDYDALFVEGNVVNDTLSLNEAGEIYYVIDTTSTPPSVAQVFSGQSSGHPTLPIASGNITLSDSTERATVSQTLSSVGGTYTIYLAAEDDLNNQQSSITNFHTFSTGQVTVNKDTTVALCLGGDDFAELNDITISERISNDFRIGSSKTVRLGLPDGYEFNTSATSDLASISGSADFSADPSISYIGNNIMRLTYTVTDTSVLDVMTISGLEIKATGSSTDTAAITRVGGTATVFGFEEDSVAAYVASRVRPVSVTITDLQGSSSDNIAVYRTNTASASDVPFTYGLIQSGDSIVFYNAEDDSFVFQKATDDDGANSDNTYSNIVLSDLITTSDLGVNTFEVTQFDADACESDAVTIGISVTGYVNTAGTTTFTSDDNTGTTLKATLPTNHSALFTGSGLINAAYNFSGYDSASVTFVPSAVGAGEHDVVYQLTNDITGVTSRDTVTFTVVASSNVFNSLEDDYCNQNYEDSLEVTYTDGQRLSFFDMVFQAYVNGVAQDTATHPLNISNGFITQESVTDTVGTGYTEGDEGNWKINPSIYTSLGYGDGGTDTVFVTFRVYDTLDGVISDLETAFLYIYDEPTDSITNVNAYYCEDDGNFDVQFLANSVFETEVGDVAGYELFKSYDGGTSYVSIRSSGVADFDPSDPDASLDTLDNVTGLYRIIHETPSSLTINEGGCSTRDTVDFEILEDASIPSLSTTEYINLLDSTAADTLYVLQFCAGENIPNFTVNTSPGDSVIWYNSVGNAFASTGSQGNTLMASTLFGVANPNNEIDQTIYFTLTTDVGVNGSDYSGCESEQRKIRIRVYEFPDNPELVTGGDANSHQVASDEYIFEFCDSLYNGSTNTYDLTITESNSDPEAYFILYDSAQNAMDTIPATDTIISVTADLGYAYDAIGDTTIWISRTIHDSSYVDASTYSFGGCESSLTRVDIYVYPTLSAPDSTEFSTSAGLQNDNNHFYLCEGESIGNLNAPASGESFYTWYEPQGGNPTSPSTTEISISTASLNQDRITESEIGSLVDVNTPGDYYFYVTQTSSTDKGSGYAGCTTDTTQIIYTVFADPITPTLTTNQTYSPDTVAIFCEGTLGDSANFDLTGLVNEAVVRVYRAASDQSLVSSTPVYTASADGAGTLNFDANNLQIVNQGQDTLYYLISQTNDSIMDGATVIFDGCETEVAERRFMTVFVYDVPSAPSMTDATLFYHEDAITSSITVNGESGSIFRYYDDSNNLVHVDTSSSGTSIVDLFTDLGAVETANTTQTYEFTVTQTQNYEDGSSQFEGCTSSERAFSVTIFDVPNAPVASNPDPQCNIDVTNTSTEISYSGVNTDQGTTEFHFLDSAKTLQQTVASTTPTSVATLTISDLKTKVDNGFSGDTTIYIVQVTNIVVGEFASGVAGDTTAVTITVYAQPAVPNTTGNNGTADVYEFCEGDDISSSVVSISSPDAGSLYVWYAEEGGTPLDTATSLNIDNSLQNTFLDGSLFNISTDISNTTDYTFYVTRVTNEGAGFGGCESDERAITIRVHPKAQSITFQSINTEYCIDDGSVTFDAQVTVNGVTSTVAASSGTGTYTITSGATSVSIDNGNGTATFTPQDLATAVGETLEGSPSTHTITLTYTTNEGCVDSATTNVTINPLPTLSMEYGSSIGDHSADDALDNSTVCYNEGTIDIQGIQEGVSATQGTFRLYAPDLTTEITSGFSGNADDGQATLIPNTVIDEYGTDADGVPVDFYVIFSYTDGSGCSNADTATVTINPIPTLDILGNDSVCYDQGSITLSATHISGSSLTGATATTGTYLIATDASFTNTFTTGFTSNGDGTATLNSQDVYLQGGVDSTGLPKTFYIRFSYTDDISVGATCSNTVDETIVISPLPRLDINMVSELCFDAGLVTYQGQHESGSDIGFVNSGTGSFGLFTDASSTVSASNVSGGFVDNGDGTFDFDASLIGLDNGQTRTGSDATYYVRFTYGDTTSVNCTNSHVESITIRTQPDLNITQGGVDLDGQVFCYDEGTLTFQGVQESVSATNGSFELYNSDYSLQVTSGFTSGTGANLGQATLLASSAVTQAGGSREGLPLDFNLIFTFTNGSGCENRDTATFTVNPQPTLDILGNDSVCYDQGSITLSATHISGSSLTGATATTGTYLIATDASFTNTFTTGFTSNGDGTATLNSQDVYLQGGVDSTGLPKTFYIRFSYTDDISVGATCSNTVDETIVISPLPRLDINMVSELCFDAGLVTYQGQHESGSDIGFVNSGTGSFGLFTDASSTVSASNVSGGFVDNGDGTFDFDASLIGLDNGQTRTGSDATYYVRFTYGDTTSVNCTNSHVESITIRTQPDLNITQGGVDLDGQVFCYDEENTNRLTFQGIQEGVNANTGSFRLFDSGFVELFDGFVSGTGSNLGTATLNTGDAVQEAGGSADGLPVELNVVFTYTNLFGCEDSDTASITVNPLPRLSISMPDTICYDYGVVSISGSHESGLATGFVLATAGTFSIQTIDGRPVPDGFIGNAGDGTATLDSRVVYGVTDSTARPKQYIVTFNYTDDLSVGAECANTVTDTITINPLPALQIVVDNEVCFDDGMATYQGRHESVDDLTFINSSQGIFELFIDADASVPAVNDLGGFVDNGNGTFDFNSELVATDNGQTRTGDNFTYYVRFTYTDESGVACDNFIIEPITIRAQPDISYVIQEIGGTELLSSSLIDTMYFMPVNYSDGGGNRQVELQAWSFDENSILTEGTFTEANGGGLVVPGAGKIRFVPDASQGGAKADPYSAAETFTVNYTYADPLTTCENSVDKYITVLPIPEFYNYDIDQQLTVDDNIRVIQACSGQEVELELSFSNLLALGIPIESISLEWHATGGDVLGLTDTVLNNLDAVHRFETGIRNDSTYYILFLNDIDGEQGVAEPIVKGTVEFYVKASFDYSTGYSNQPVVNVSTQTERQSVDIGETPKPRFRWEGGTVGERVTFYMQPEQSNIPISDVLFVVNEDTVYSRLRGRGESNLDIQEPFILDPGFNQAGEYDLQLTYNSLTSCVSTEQKFMIVNDRINVPQGGSILSDFEGGSEGWHINDIDYSLGLEENFGYDTINVLTEQSWILSSSSDFHDIEGAQPGIYWVTGERSSYLSGEHSWVYSPTYNFSELDLPTVSLDFACYMDNKDAVVLQYSLDDGITWRELGGYTNFDGPTGRYWYNNESVNGNPGNQDDIFTGTTGDIWNSNFVGWTFSGGRRDEPDENVVKWRTAINKLDVISDRTSVRFRFALGAVTGTKEDNLNNTYIGFAFDNFRIYDRNKIVLLEQFSTLSESTTIPVLDTIQQRIVNDIGTDAIMINYFTNLNSSGQDALSSRNRNDPGARALYYGVADAPSSIISGSVQSGNPLASNVNEIMGWNVNRFNEIGLEQALFEITDVTISGSDQEVGITAGFRSLVDIVDEDAELSFRFAIIEKEVDGAAISSEYAGNVYRNVLRKMLPSAGGFTFVGSVSEGQAVFGDLVFESNWAIRNVYDATNLAVVAFVQLDTDVEELGLPRGTILQAAMVDVGTDKIEPDASNVTSVDDWSKQEFTIRPNPTDDIFEINIHRSVDKELNWAIYDQAGRKMGRGIIKRGKNSISVSSELLPSGLYMLHLFNEEIQWEPKRLIIVH